MTRPTVAILETGTQVQKVLNDPARRNRVDVWLAAGPEAAWHLQMNGIDYAKLEDFYDESSLSDKAEHVFMRQVAWADRVDGWLQQEIPQFKHYNIQPAHAHFPFLKRFFDQLEIATYQLGAFLETCQPDDALYFEPPIDDPSPQVRLLSSVIGRVLPILAKRNDIKTTPIPDSRTRVLVFTGQASPSRWRRIADYLPSNLLRELSLFRKLGILEYFRLTPCRLGGGDKVLVLNSSYDVAPVLPELAKCKFHIHFNARGRADQDSVIRQTLAGLWNRILEDEDFWAPLPVQNEEMCVLAKSRLSYWWHHVIPETWEVFMAARTSLRAKGFLGLVTASAGGAYRHRDIAMILAARSLNVPVIMYQHGGFVGACQNLTWDLTDLWQADYELCYGEGVRTYFDKRSRCHATPLATPVPVGSARLDRVRRSSARRSKKIRMSLMRGDARPLVLYVPTAFCGPYRNLCCDSYPDVAYLELQQRVIDVFRRTPDVRLIYKVFSETHSANLVPQIIRQTLPDAIVVDDIRLTDLMWAVDSIIVDFPSSALLEVLLTNKHLLVYADQYSLRMFDEAKGLLRRRAVLAETGEEFVTQVETFIQTGNVTELSEPDDAFLQAYGTYLRDGRSALRATDAIETIIQGHSKNRMAQNARESVESNGSGEIDGRTLSLRR
jgi:hypothetical protein